MTFLHALHPQQLLPQLSRKVKLQLPRNGSEFWLFQGKSKKSDDLQVFYDQHLSTSNKNNTFYSYGSFYLEDKKYTWLWLPNIRKDFDPRKKHSWNCYKNHRFPLWSILEIQDDLRQEYTILHCAICCKRNFYCHASITKSLSEWQSCLIHGSLRSILKNLIAKNKKQRDAFHSQRWTSPQSCIKHLNHSMKIIKQLMMLKTQSIHNDIKLHMKRCHFNTIPTHILLISCLSP